MPANLYMTFAICMLAIKIDAYQSIQLFGYKRQPILTLSWNDVKRENFTWRYLRSLDFKAEDLQLMQPDKQEWLQRGGVNMQDLKDMLVFPVNPLIDFGADLGELWNMECSVDDMLKMNITYTQLIQKGITPAIMAAFRLPLSAWVQLGFQQEHAACMHANETQLIFGLDQTELVNILNDFNRNSLTEKNKNTIAET